MKKRYEHGAPEAFDTTGEFWVNAQDEAETIGQLNDLLDTVISPMDADMVRMKMRGKTAEWIGQRYGISRQAVDKRIAESLGVLRGESKEKYSLSTRGLERTHCIRGHRLTAQNVYIYPDGRRQCRLCRRATDKRWKRRHASDPGAAAERSLYKSAYMKEYRKRKKENEEFSSLSQEAVA